MWMKDSWYLINVTDFTFLSVERFSLFTIKWIGWDEPPNNSQLLNLIHPLQITLTTLPLLKILRRCEVTL
jgi:hypothetical protein